ncbi:MAG TPA: hypothetical protein VLZ89_13455 [Anaerolineales bacterium]|nr:hypothetical protein [Anaerolineales bacterium]
MARRIHPLFSFLITLILIAVLSLFGPSDQTLGSNVRIVYLHGAWVLTAELALALAGLGGMIALITQRALFYKWSAALGRTGIIFWITYLPLSIWAMQANWNGLFLAEPRFRLAVTFAVVGVLLQLGLWFISLNWLTGAANLVFIVVLLFEFSRAQYVMHPPPSPILNSGNWQIIGFFLALNVITWLAAYFMAVWFVHLIKE